MMVDGSMPKDPAWERHRASLATQAAFVRSFSPLTAALLEQACQWLDDPEARGREFGKLETVVDSCKRLVELLTDEDEDEDQDTGWIDDLKPALRLNAYLHWYVLQEDPRVVDIVPYYATVTSHPRKPTDEEFPRRLLSAMDALGAELFERARNWRVITNETSRGIVWLLPTVLVGAEAVHLVELQCSVGLNLYAEQRGFDLAWTSSKRLHLGRRKKEEYLTVCEGSMPELEGFTEQDCRGPEVLTRVGGERNPSALEQPDFESHLEASIWGDQRRRLDTLRSGMKVHRRARAGAGNLRPVEILPLELPNNLTEFLAKAIPANADDPVVVYNTYATAYLSDVNERAFAREMRDFARSWSLRHKLPWMWVRFEPARAGRQPPHPGWCNWVVELFRGSKHKTIELGWAHPHLARAEFGPGLIQLRNLRDRR